jgi:hypothetical protein
MSCVFDSDIILYGSQDHWADSYNAPLSGYTHTENLTVNPVGQNAEFILEVMVRVREPEELKDHEVNDKYFQNTFY